jgi:hypothetical protein
VLLQEGPALGAEGLSGYQDLYMQSTGSGALSPLLKNAPEHRPSGESSSDFQLTFAGASADFSHVIFEANDALATPGTPGAPGAVDGGAGKNNLYESVGGVLGLVNVLPDGSTEPGAVFGSGEELTIRRGNSNITFSNFDHAISADGSRVYWTDQNKNRVYVRVGERSSFEVPDPSNFLAASVDGSKVLMNDGYIYELHESEEAFEAVASLGEGLPGFQGILGSSEDFSTIYFVDTTVLPGAEPSVEGRVPVAGAANLYEWHDGTSTVIATIGRGLELPTHDWAAAISDRSTEVTPNGRYVAFLSAASLTGYDNVMVEGECSIAAGSTCSEVFEYDSVTGRVVCASCNPSGARP